MEHTEQTLGKRIMAHRKRLGLTQDQLAERLGVTAQAVSKWENDQSCPDIATLPKLADIFGTSVDALLGREEPAQEGQIVEDGESEADSREPAGIHFQSGDNKAHWDFQWDGFGSGRKSAIGFAIAVLLVGCLTLVSTLLEWDVSFWSILWPCAILYVGIMGLYPKLSFFCLACTLLGGYFLLYNLGVIHLNLGWELVLPVLLVVLGISLLVDALRKKRRPKGGHIHTSDRSPASQFEIDGTEFVCTCSFGEDSQVITMPLMTGGRTSMSFGEMTIDLSGVEELSPDCTLDADCSFGELILRIPRRFAVDAVRSTAFASITFQGEPASVPDGILHLNANASFGEIQVNYI